jgi:hypothetical protein
MLVAGFIIYPEYAFARWNLASTRRNATYEEGDYNP